MTWFTESIISMFCFAGITLTLRALTETGLKSEVINFYFFLFTAIGFLPIVLIRETRVSIPASSLPLFVLLTIIALGANYFSLTAIAKAPNPGYVPAIQTFRIVVITLASIALFGSEITVKKAVGIVLSLVGVILLGT